MKSTQKEFNNAIYSDFDSRNDSRYNHGHE